MAAIAITVASCCTSERCKTYYPGSSYGQLLKKQCQRMHSKETRKVKYTCVHHRFGTEDEAGKQLAKFAEQ